ncbi:hypothetical protein FD06_GL000586 [Apilactobacillus ozensis DSM 23829 = JCM 17196]|uniref:Segregation and condensation protein B n=1 Tax=Apilactobacillus ozensis DSM 23829 = JCM 17196 TaxID=1423781 RepID=A0A0R2AME5_9LACO|nr:SMC-Scp complex subunit ScpB [Apilactobacillus ozensis]KRM67866.1 hypothetical protein FD06_GL000586 [Apilactobacillus ozensis DSM 23829 = JCM 17196]
MISEKGKIEALVYASGSNGISLEKLSEVMNLPDYKIKNTLKELSEQLIKSNDSGLLIIQSDDKYKIATKQSINSLIVKLVGNTSVKLSQSNLETLTIIAYRQPITRIELDEIRGVNSSRTIQKLIELKLIYKSGKKTVLGNPALYSTTSKFLKTFGLNTLDDLPNKEIKEN